MGYFFRLTARVILYAPSHRPDNTYHGLFIPVVEHWLERDIAQCPIKLETFSAVLTHGKDPALRASLGPRHSPPPLTGCMDGPLLLVGPLAPRLVSLMDNAIVETFTDCIDGTLIIVSYLTYTGVTIRTTK